jgi:hypothetical protein
MSLPLPDSDALAASHALQQEIATAIQEAGGAIPFSRFMELALYAPRLGYYSGGAAKLGSSGDFTTAPEITPLFGAALARAAAAIIAQSAPNIIEFGAGTGKLARDVLTALAEEGVQVERYTIIELSGELRARQQEALKDFPQVEWRDGFPGGLQRRRAGQRSARRHAGRAGDQNGAGLAPPDGDGRGGPLRLCPGRARRGLAAQLARQIPDAALCPRAT